MAKGKVLAALIGTVLITSCGSWGSLPVIPLGTAINSAKEQSEDKLEVESRGLISRWLLDRNYNVTTVTRFLQKRPAEKVAIRGIFWSTYRTKRGWIFKNGYWNVSLRDELSSDAGGPEWNGRQRYNQDYGRNYIYWQGSASGFFGKYQGYDDNLYDDYEDDERLGCGSSPGGANRGSPYDNRGRARSGYEPEPTRGNYPDRLSPDDCYQEGQTGGPGWQNRPDERTGSPYRSPRNAFRGQDVDLLRIKDDAKSYNFKLYNGERVLAFVSGTSVKEIRLLRDGSAIYKGWF
ncbi:MAG: hypothetical protein HY692_00070 [Cyanobacteria bacterium NC_groundwater_1444_Ag_S-0.65um_54_12]|nr:hypothetical protein [Cyanobacteria bacterium NC_groundwater_1444_Ag_S-0.65um_54_12]